MISHHKCYNPLTIILGQRTMLELFLPKQKATNENCSTLFSTIVLEDHGPIDFYNKTCRFLGLLSVQIDSSCLLCVINYPVNQWRTIDHLSYLEFKQTLNSWLMINVHSGPTYFLYYGTLVYILKLTFFLLFTL